MSSTTHISVGSGERLPAVKLPGSVDYPDQLLSIELKFTKNPPYRERKNFTIKCTFLRVEIYKFFCKSDYVFSLELSMEMQYKL